MNRRVILRVLGFLAIAVGLAMIPAAIISIYQDHRIEQIAFVISAAIPLILGLITLALTRGEKVDLKIKEGFAITTFGWIAAGLFGAMPYLLTGTCSPIDAFFESLSGFTTTGATIFDEIETLPKGLLFWRSLTQWIGGMGIVLLSVAILPALGVGGMQLFKAEVPGPTADRLSPRIQNTAKILWGVYFGLTALEVVLLLFGGMSLFDAVCHAFTTLSTGGFSTRDSSVGAFHSTYIDAVITVFMFVAGVNFSLHYWLLRKGDWKRYFRNEEFVFYAILTVVAALVLWIAIEMNTEATFETGFRWSVFQTVSILTSTGYGTSDFLLWGFGAQTMIFVMMFAGACAGSTAGGIKLMRILLLAKHANRVMKKALHPQGVFNIRHSGTLVDDDVMMNVLGFFLLYFALMVGSTVLVAATGVDFTTSISATVSMLSNIGPGLGDVGPASTYASLPAAAKLILTACMLFGRLELFTVLVVFMPMFWRKT